MAQPPAVLVERALSLAAKCREVEAEAHKSREMAIASLEKIGASPLVDVHLKGDEVQLLTTMTLIYRAIPAPEGSASRFCDECIETARRATNTHLTCMELVRQDPHARNMYVHWYVQGCNPSKDFNILTQSQESGSDSVRSFLRSVLLCYRNNVGKRLVSPQRIQRVN